MHFLAPFFDCRRTAIPESAGRGAAASRYSFTQPYFSAVSIDYSKYPVPRMRHHTSPNYYLPHDRQQLGDADYPPLYESLDWSRMFADGGAPELLDIGCGMGRFLLDYAQACPQQNILGIEVRRAPVEWIDGVINGEKIDNAAVVWYSVVNGIPFVASDSIERIFYFFPDPWFKKRHNKRRAFTAEFLDECARVLKPGGVLYLMTDVPDVDDYQRKILDRHPRFSYVECSDEQWELPVKTDQEILSINRGVGYTRLRCEVHKS